MTSIRRVLALLLAAILLLAAPAALAETREVSKLTIGNPKLSMAGMQLADLTGLSIEGTTYNDGTRDVLRLRLLGGDEEAADAYLGFDGRWLLAGADGISSLYGVPIEKLAGYSDYLEQMALLAELFSEDTLEEIMMALAMPIMTYAAQVEQAKIDEGTRVIDHAAGQIEMSGTTVVLRADDIKALIEEIGDGLNAIPAIEKLMSTAGDVAGYDIEKGADPLDMMGDMTITTWTAADGVTARMELSWTMHDPEDKADVVEFYEISDTYAGQSGETLQDLQATATQDGEEIARVSGNAVIHETADSIAYELDMAGEALIDETWEDVVSMNIYMYPAGYTADNPDRALFGMRSQMRDGETPQSFDFSGYYAPAGDQYSYDELSLALHGGNAEDNFSLELLSQNEHRDGNEYYGMQLTAGENDELLSGYYTFEGQYIENALGGEDHMGKLVIGGGDATVSFEFSADIATESAEVDFSELPSFEGMPVNVLTMGEKENDLLQAEAMALLLRLENSLSSSVPGLMALINSGML